MDLLTILPILDSNLTRETVSTKTDTPTVSWKTTFQLRHLAEEVELNTWYRVKCIVEENKVTIINKDTEYQTIREFTGIINRGRFATSGTTTALQFRNFKAY